MNRSTATLLLGACLVVLAALLGLAGYRLYTRVYLRAVRRPFAITPITIPMSAVSDIEVTSKLRSTPAGIVVDVKIINNTSQPFTEVRLTDLEYDKSKVRGLPQKVTGVAAHSVKTVTFPLPTLKTTSPSYEQVTYEYDTKYGGGSGSFSMGTSPSKPTKKPTTHARGITI